MGGGLSARIDRIAAGYRERSRSVGGHDGGVGYRASRVRPWHPNPFFVPSVAKDRIVAGLTGALRLSGFRSHPIRRGLRI